MSGYLTTHVLDTVHGAPAAGMAIALFVRDDTTGGAGSPTWRLLREVVTNADGRVDGPMLAGADLRPGVYRLVFEVERYFRASTATGIPGTGIGLSLVKDLVELYQGKLEVSSDIGQGTAFSVSLPVQEV